jgi:hypothetical protein
LDTYTCENCIMQKEETIPHLFLKCNYVKRCWKEIGLAQPRTSNPHLAVQRIRRQLAKLWSMEVVIVMLWCIWKTRNGWIFENTPPTIPECMGMFKKEMLLICYSMEHSIAYDVRLWIQTQQERRCIDSTNVMNKKILLVPPTLNLLKKLYNGISLTKSIRTYI